MDAKYTLIFEHNGCTKYGEKFEKGTHIVDKSTYDRLREYSSGGGEYNETASATNDIYLKFKTQISNRIDDNYNDKPQLDNNQEDMHFSNDNNVSEEHFSLDNNVNTEITSNFSELNLSKKKHKKGY